MQGPEIDGFAGIRVCIVTPPRASKVPARFLEELTALVAASGHHVTLIWGSDARPAFPETVLWIRLRSRFSQSGRARSSWAGKAAAALRILHFQLEAAVSILKQRGRVDVVIFYLTWPYYLLPALAARLAGAKTIDVVTRSPSRAGGVTRLYAIQDRLLMHVVDYISPESRRLLATNRLDVAPPRLLATSARFVRTEHFRPLTPFAARTLRVAFIGRLVPEKGAHLLAQAIPLVLATMPDVEFHIAGEGELAPIFRDLAVQHRAVQVSEWVRPEMLPETLSSCRLLVLPSESEGLPTILLESMACETPVLATAVGAIPDIVEPGETGFLLPSSAPEDIARSIVAALRAPHLSEIASRARGYVEAKFSWDSAVARWDSIVRLSPTSKGEKG